MNKEKLKYEDFVHQICIRVKDKIGDDYVVYPHEVIKQNDTVLHAIMISERNRSNKTMPVIYLEQYYERYKEDKDLDECAESIVEFYKNSVRKDIDSMVSNMFEWDKIRNSIVPVVVSKEQNKLLIKNLVHKTYLDLAVYYVVKFDEVEEDSSVAVVKVSKDMCKSWGITEEELQEQAMINMRNDGYHIKTMKTVIKELMLDACFDFLPDDIESDKAYMYVLTNRSKHYGAAGIIYNEILEQFAEMIDKNFYILPSSLHEVILLPDDGNIQYEELNEMVRQINEDQVPREDVLENHVYYYNKEKQIVDLMK